MSPSVGDLVIVAAAADLKSRMVTNWAEHKKIEPENDAPCQLLQITSAPSDLATGFAGFKRQVQ